VTTNAVEPHERAGRIELEVMVDASDTARMVGRHGRTISALLVLADAAGGRHGLRVAFEVSEGAGR
jgi:predicted RNA-binding protein YlqC (UPF0109 family)